MANTVKNQPPATSTFQDPNPMENIQHTYERNSKRINTIGTIVLLAVVGFFAYKKFVQDPKATKAANAIAYAQNYFAQDSLQKALNGDGQNIGFLQIISRYGGTESGNLAQYYAGLSFLQLGDPNSAIKHLEEFDPEGTNVQYAAFGALADAYMDAGKVKEGLEYYKKAAADKENDVLTPVYLYRAALAHQMLNQPDQAIESLKRIRNEFPQSQQARDTEKELARLGVID